MNAERCCMIIDAHPVVRLGIRRVLEPRWEFFEELPDGREAVELLTSVGRFDVAIVEMRNGVGSSPSGTETIRAVLRAQPSLGVVAHGDRLERHAIGEAFEAGASAYVSKRSAPRTMCSAVDSAADAVPFIDPAIDPTDGRIPALTRRQREILQLFADGLTTEDAARRLGLSAETIRTHAKASLPRLGARDRAHAIAIAMRGSLID